MVTFAAERLTVGLYVLATEEKWDLVIDLDGGADAA